MSDQIIRITALPGQKVIVTSPTPTRLSTTVSKTKLTATVTASGTWAEPQTTPAPNAPCWSP